MQVSYLADKTEYFVKSGRLYSRWEWDMLFPDSKVSSIIVLL